MDAAMDPIFREQLVDRRKRLETAINDVGQAPDLVRLLQEVDSALTRMDTRTYGTCEVCEESVETEFLLSNPLIQYCLCNLNAAQQRSLQQDLDLAARIQWALLPRQDQCHSGWETHYRYEPVGPVSGDYCDIVAGDNHGGEMFMMMGDVSGKGIAASLLMAHLNALVRSLIETRLPVDRLVERANRLFSENTIETHYVTLVCARALPTGEIEVCNAGHCPPIVLRGGEVATVGSTGFPVGFRGSTPYDIHRVTLNPGDTMFLYTDGLTETFNLQEKEYGAERLARFLLANAGLPPRTLAAACLSDVAAFQGAAPRADDLSLMVVRRSL